jgi:hypothetical protein
MTVWGACSLVQTPRSLRKPRVSKTTLIRALSAGICGFSFLGFWSLQVSRRLSGDFWCPVSGSQNSVPGGWVLSPRSWDSRGSDCGFSAAVIRFIVQGSKRGRRMSHAYQLHAEVLHRGQGPQGRAQVEVPQIYTIVQCMPVEADGRLRYRIKSDKIERVVTEDELSYCQ